METPDQNPTMEDASTATSTAVKADIGKRIVAAIIDAVAAGFVGIILNLILAPVGGLVAAGYWLVRDGLDFDFMKGRSLGKQVMSLKLVREDGMPMDMQASIRRNWIIAVPSALSSLISASSSLVLLPLVFIVSLAGFAVFVFETYKVFSDPEGKRWGDSQAGTHVVDAV